MKFFRHLLMMIFLSVAGFCNTSCEEVLIDEEITADTEETDKEDSEDKKDPEDDENSEEEEENKDDKEEENEEQEEEVKVKGGEFVLLFTNDFHSQIEPIDKRDSRDGDMGGIARIKALVDSVRLAEPHVLLTDSGDMVEGTFYFNLYEGEVEMMILNELGYDVRTLGNHDFSKKVVGLNEMLSMCNVPVVSTNYDYGNTVIAGYARKSMILKAGSVNVGFIGLNIDFDGLVDPEAHEGVTWRHAITVADFEAERLRLQGADIVIALSHIGLGSAYSGNSDIAIANNTRHIDMILSGHTHTLPNERPVSTTNLDGRRIIIGHAGSNGKYLGYAKIKISKEGVPTYEYKIFPITSRLDSKIDQDFADMIENRYVSGTDVNDVIGYCPNTLYRSYNDESPYYMDHPLANMTTDALIWMAKKYHKVDADVSFYNTGGIRNIIFNGDCKVKDIYHAFPFDNKLTTLSIKGNELRKVFSNIAAKEGGLYVNGDVRLVISEKKVKSLTIKGEPIDDDKTYVVSTINYVANLAKNGMSHLPKTESEEYITRYFVEYFRHHAEENEGEISYKSDGRVKFE